MTDTMKFALTNPDMQVFMAMPPGVQKEMANAARKGEAEYLSHDGTWRNIVPGNYETLHPGVAYRVVKE